MQPLPAKFSKVLIRGVINFAVFIMLNESIYFLIIDVHFTE